MKIIFYCLLSTIFVCAMDINKNWLEKNMILGKDVSDQAFYGNRFYYNQIEYCVYRDKNNIYVLRNLTEKRDVDFLGCVSAYNLEISLCGRYVAVSYYSSEYKRSIVLLYDVAHETKTYFYRKEWIDYIGFSPSGKYFLIASDSEISLYYPENALDKNYLFCLFIDNVSKESISFSTDERYLLFRSSSALILCDMKTKKNIKLSDFYNAQASFSPCGNYIMGAKDQYSNITCIWDTKGNLIKEFGFMGNCVPQCRMWSRNGDAFLSACTKNESGSFDVYSSTGDLLLSKTLPYRPHSIFISPLNRFAVVTPHVYDVCCGKLSFDFYINMYMFDAVKNCVKIFPSYSHFFNDIIFSKLENYVIFNGSSLAMVWQVSSIKLLYVIHDPYLYQIYFDQDESNICILSRSMSKEFSLPLKVSPNG